MGRALDEAHAALAHDDVPIGAVVARLSDGAIVASAHNERELRGDPTRHAEVLALQAAASVVGGGRLGGAAPGSAQQAVPGGGGGAVGAPGGPPRVRAARPS